jgi:aspartate carbamoyltransferase regulatory subunit
MLRIEGINNGIVIDHIKAGRGMEIYHYLQLEKSDCSVAIIKNAKSNKSGKKDIIKIEDAANMDIDIDILGVLDPNITVNFIKNDTIVEKRHPNLPERVTNIIQCKNPRCITSEEKKIPHIFKLTNREKNLYRCIYCEQKFKRN